MQSNYHTQDYFSSTSNKTSRKQLQINVFNILHSSVSDLYSSEFQGGGYASPFTGLGRGTAPFASPLYTPLPALKIYISLEYFGKTFFNQENCDGKRFDASPLVRPVDGLNGKGIEGRVVDGKELDYKGLNGGKQSRIPDIRSKRSPQKEVISSRYF